MLPRQVTRFLIQRLAHCFALADTAEYDDSALTKLLSSSGIAVDTADKVCVLQLF